MKRRSLHTLLAASMSCCAACTPSSECCDIARQDIGALCAALESYALDHAGVYPLSLAQLIERRPDGKAYVQHETGIFKDPWKRAYIYVPPGPHQPLQVISLGSDARIGGTGDAADRAN